MSIKPGLKFVWTVISVLSVSVLTFHWFGYDSKTVQFLILGLNAAMLLLSLPCSIFVVPVVVSAYYFMAINPFSADGIYLNTIFLFVVGVMQWFWIARFWSPNEPQLQTLYSAGGKLN